MNNNKFDFSRFKKVIVYDFNQYLRRYGVVMAVLIGLPTILVWLSSLSVLSWGSTGLDDVMNISPVIRFSAITSGWNLAIFLAPAWLYGFINMKKDGPQYATLPATYLEKFCSILFYTIIFTPVAYMVAALLVDILLTILPFGGYQEFIWNLNLLEYYDDVYYGLSEAFTEMMLSNSWISNILGVVASSSLMFFFSTVFKKHKLAKTCALIFGVFFVLMIAFFAAIPSILVYIGENGAYFEEHFLPYVSEHIMPIVYYGMLIYEVVQILVCYVWGYHRMKRMKF